jgi:hypothetical protein
MPKKLTNETSFRTAYKQKTKRCWMLVSGYWIFKGFSFIIPTKDGIFDQHQASSIQHQLDLLIQAERWYSVSCRFEAKLRY